MLIRRDLAPVAALMAALVGLDLLLELLGSATSAGSVGGTLFIWALILWRFHASAVGRPRSEVFTGMGWAFIWRYLMIVFLLIVLPVLIVTLVFVAGLKTVGSEQEAMGLFVATGITGLPLLFLSLFGFALAGTVFPLIVDQGKGTFRQAMRISKGRRWWMIARLFVWTFGPNFLPFLLVVIASQQYSDASFLDPETHEPNIRLILIAFLNNCLSAWGTANGAAIFSRVYLAKRDGSTARSDAAMPAD